MEKNNSIAIVFTCFNRKEKTINCIKTLKNQEGLNEFDLYVCDDGSTDGTSEAIMLEYPSATIIKGTGSLFWSKGMYCAMKEAVKKDYDMYLMINDDVEFINTMWQTMSVALKYNSNSGVVGCTLSKEFNKQSYGGSKFISSSKGDYVGEMLKPNKNEYINVDLANWNCFLITRDIVQNIGLIDDRYEHAMGDFDYSFRMRKKDYKIILAKEYVGYCENNGIENTFKDKNVSRVKRIKKLFAPNGLPIKSWYYFTKKYYIHGRYKNFIFPYLKFILYIILGENYN